MAFIKRTIKYTTSQAKEAKGQRRRYLIVLMWAYEAFGTKKEIQKDPESLQN